ncbi:Uncharacterized MobA-related protein OS=Burkholderia gladioli (strain BSR3) GN=bgla_2g09620 PE=4 SV=1 [Gemmataceae bacterium]|nr:Uncharacterized MobA-related protein OS=Burkholderia gladioli (strain BSR3) GN=bgla_2g09620 PE=4 SV=1 [Gemmataceae bacterium]VTT98877.1 Uncharacterized MobA-related protein OS=Burkholderia gladioli (strain BSR3) GN=bgla_2g09620 PE=4 SV=1 [Gemmataceae bacterium]
MPQTFNELFDPAPEAVGLRGDRPLWAAMRDRLRGVPLPDTAEEFNHVISELFAELTGVPLGHPEPVFLPHYRGDAGGMSSGYVSPEFWRDRGLQLLWSRWRG